MPAILTKKNTTRFVRSYVAKAAATPIPRLHRNDAIEFFKALKRTPVKGHYNGMSVFEVANGTLSDLVVLGLADKLLREGLPGHATAASVRVLLGTEDDGGTDVVAKLGGGHVLLAECFNVAPSFFQAKLNKTRKKLRELNKSGTQVIAFNAGAEGTWKPRPSPFIYSPIDVAWVLKRFR